MDAPVTGVNTHIIKEPIGFIRVIQIPMAILAFATTAGYSAEMQIPYACSVGQQSISLPISWGYPFDLTDVKVKSNFCDTFAAAKVIAFTYGAVSQSQFFVCTGVLSFLYGLAILAVYLLSWNIYKTDPRWSMADFLITGILALFWFIAACAWASGVTLVKSVTDPQAIGAQLRSRHGSFPCKAAELGSLMCNPEQTWNYASLNISLIVGFSCFGLWASNLWFIYKETIWYQNRMAAKGASDGGGTGPQFGAEQGSRTNIGPGGDGTRPPGTEFQY